ncbi:glycosyltransferase [Thomasclavelia ramosa]|uniref:Glycosyltransferase n=2 Tax=Thomasclavelia ramosa TaxID=1547 RepID=A0A3E3EDG4_9FIRM|nr:glycosyltransferase [Thomasclavelia ramosa]
MSIGQISNRKNQKVIIEAISMIANPKIKYVIVGFGEMEEKLKKIAEELHVTDRIIFAGYRQDAKALLHCADLFAFPSLQEGLPASLMEAMSVGLPAVASSIRGNIDLIHDGENGYLCNSNDAIDFSNKIYTIYSNRDVSNKMESNTKRIIKRFDCKIVQNMMKDLYYEEGGNDI